MEPVRVLQVVGKMDRAGAETLLMNLYRNICRDRVQFDFLTHREGTGDYDQEIMFMGGKVYHLCPMTLKNAWPYWCQLNTFFREHPEYRVIHSHIDAMSTLPLAGAKQAGIPVRIAHSHNTSFPHDRRYPLRLVAQLLLPFQATHYFACSTQSAEFLFPSWIIRSGNFTVLPNAIPLEQFTYSPTNRQRKRNEMGIPEEAFVIGHVGRFCSQKNHEKLVRVFAEIHRRHAGSLLLLAGQGELQEKIVGLCEELKLGNTVRFLGIRSDIEQLMQAFDLFILPSFYEGFPVVGVEAQAADLPCLFSGQIKKDIALTVNVRFLPLRAPDTVWADNALELRRTVRKDRSEELAKQGFDIRRQAKRMEEFYQSVGGG